MNKVDAKCGKNTWAIGGGLLLGLGVGFFFLHASALYFVGSLIAGMGTGLILATILNNRILGKVDKGISKMKAKHTDIDNQRSNIAEQLAELSLLLGMMPSDETITVHAPLSDEIMVLSDWLSAMRNSFLKLSILIGKELDIQLQ